MMARQLMKNKVKPTIRQVLQSHLRVHVIYRTIRPIHISIPLNHNQISRWMHSLTSEEHATMLKLRPASRTPTSS